MPARKRIVLLGATGSIGTNTLEVLAGHRDELELVGIAARSNVDALAEIARKFNVPNVCCYDSQAHDHACNNGLFPSETRLLTGLEGLTELATLPDADLVVAAVVGTTGLKPVLAAIKAGKDIALANKEILVLAGKFVIEAARRHGVRILPLDSEHNAIFQCLEAGKCEEVSRLILTASGGAFRDRPLDTLSAVRPEEALVHPNWSMGPKITVDSATMANKGLEIIEAHWLFGVEADEIDVVIHPQSIVHSMVEFVDGSILAQLSPPSMTFAIQHTLFYPDRLPSVRPSLSFSDCLSLDFRPPDVSRYPCLTLARQALTTGGTAPAVFNAANEVAVSAFLEGRLSFTGIARTIDKSLEAVKNVEPSSLDEVLFSDGEARRIAASVISKP